MTGKKIIAKNSMQLLWYIFKIITHCSKYLPCRSNIPILQLYTKLASIG